MQTFTLIHVLISLTGIISGLVVLYGLVNSDRMDRWTAVFLITTVATSVTGFMFPFEKLLPSHITGILSLLVLAPVLFARYPRRMQGAWRLVYVLGGMFALYLNVFVLVVQGFLKVPALNQLAPTQAEPPFLVAGSAKRLEEDMVFSVEPGIYLPGRFGVRLEIIASVGPHGAEMINAPSAPDLPVSPA